MSPGIGMLKAISSFSFKVCPQTSCSNVTRFLAHCLCLAVCPSLTPCTLYCIPQHWIILHSILHCFALHCISVCVCWPTAHSAGCSFGSQLQIYRQVYIRVSSCAFGSEDLGWQLNIVNILVGCEFTFGLAGEHCEHFGCLLAGSHLGWLVAVHLDSSCNIRVICTSY